MISELLVSSHLVSCLHSNDRENLHCDSVELIKAAPSTFRY